MINNHEMPIGFTMALAEHTESLIRFSNFSRPEQEAVINRARQIQSRDEMHQFVRSLAGQEGGRFS